jgi:hypothetical protein
MPTPLSSRNRAAPKICDAAVYDERAARRSARAAAQDPAVVLGQRDCAGGTDGLRPALPEAGCVENLLLAHARPAYAM